MSTIREMTGLASNSDPGRRRRAWPAVVLAALALRAIVPAGYMPGSLPDGELMVLCPDASATAFAVVAGLRGPDAGHAHAHHHAGGDTSSAAGGAGADSRCPIGSALTLVAIAPSRPATTAADTAAGYASPTPAAPRDRRAARHFDTRAPPPA